MTVKSAAGLTLVGLGRRRLSGVVVVGKSRSSFRQTDVTRAMRAAINAGQSVKRIEIDKDGRIVVVIGKPEDGGSPRNEWDEDKSLWPVST